MTKKNKIMGEIFSFIKDVFEVFADAYKYAELDFFKLKTEVLTLIHKANAKGYGTPDYASLSIKVESRIETTVVIEIYYNKGNGKYQKFKKTIDLGVLTNIPQTIKRRLERSGEVAIKLSDFNNMLAVSEKDIIPNIEFKYLYAFSLKNARGIPSKKELHITDELFYYKVILVYVYDNGEKEIKTKYFGNILSIPDEVANKIESNEDKSCYIDVTNSK